MEDHQHQYQYYGMLDAAMASAELSTVAEELAKTSSKVESVELALSGHGSYLGITDKDVLLRQLEVLQAKEAQLQKKELLIMGVVAAASATHPASSLSLPLQQTMAAATAIAAPSTTLSPAGISPPPPVPASANSSHERCGVAAFAQEAVADGVSVAGAPAVAADGTAGEGGVAPGGMSSGYGGDGDVQGGGVVTAAGGGSSEGAGLTVAAPAAMLTSAHQLFAQNPAPVATAVGDPGTGTVKKPPLAVAITGGPGLALPGPLGGGVGGVQFGGAPTDEKPPHSAAAAGGGGGTMSGHNINEMGVAAAHHQYYQNGAGAGLVPAAVTGMSLAPNGRRSGGGGHREGVSSLEPDSKRRARLTAKCQYPDCTTVCTFGRDGDKHASYCAVHKQEGMINIKGRRCHIADCQRRPGFAFPGEKRGKFCATHRQPGMVDVVSRKCQVESGDCDRQPVYGWLGERATRCGTHKLERTLTTLATGVAVLEKMYDVRGKRCQAKGCIRQPGFGHPCAKLASEFGYTHLSTGDLLREEQKKESDLATKIAECIRDGQLVPSSTMVALVKDAILKDENNGFLLDGFPRSTDNLEAWFKDFSDDEVQVPFTLFLHCPKEELRKRLLERGETSGRADDNVETVLKRFDTFEKESLPVVERLERLGMVRKVSTVPPRELVSHRVRRYFRGCRLVDPVERTLALIKPDAVGAGNADAIIARAEQEGFVVVAKAEGRLWSQEDAEVFYSEHRGRPFFDTLVAFMTSGPLVQLCLEKVGAIKAWRQLAGPTNSTDATDSEPSSLRALYGTDGTKNAVHGSDSFSSALREVNFCFNRAAAAAAAVAATSSTSQLDPAGGGEQKTDVGGGFGFDGFAEEEKTLALLKPGVSELYSGEGR
ncbi:unnamed protein product, partial [Pylaiella littoralis]